MAKEIQFKDSTGEKYYPRPSHPIGTVIITSNNVNPKIDYGGTWELIDKEFKDFSETYSTNVSEIATSTNTTVSQVVLQRTGHTIILRITFTTKVDLSNTDVELFKLNLSKLGVLNLKYGAYFISIPCNNKTGFILGSFEYNGVIKSSNVVMKGTETVMPSGAIPVFFTERNIPYNLMLDSACDKFYWKRTA